MKLAQEDSNSNPLDGRENVIWAKCNERRVPACLLISPRRSLLEVYSACNEIFLRCAQVRLG